MSATDTHRTAFKWAAELLDLVMADVTPDQAHWQPPGTANPIAAQYAHALCGLDALVHVVLLGGDPLFASVWAGRTGISAPQWQADPEWARAVRVDLAAAREYAGAVYAAADAYLDSIGEAELRETRDLTAFGLGVPTVDWLLSAIGVGHVNNMTGEISCLKGVLGGRGYPF